jgi:hypothetical protein
VEEVNAAGGLLGRKVEVISRDDAGKPEEALRHAVELTSKEQVDVLAGGFLSNVGLALADHAVKNKRLFVASEPLTRCHRLGQGQPLHLPPAPQHLHAGGNAGRRSGQAAGQALGHDRAQL